MFLLGGYRPGKSIVGDTQAGNLPENNGQVQSVTMLEKKTRFDIISMLDRPTGNIGVELGVARGDFSKKMVECGSFDHFFGVDAYSDHHDVREYKQALHSIGLRANFTLLRMRFDEALDLFEDNSLSLVYIDGYAHAGQNGGETIYSWATKVKPGGVLAGHDYCPRFPLVVKAVNCFVADTGFKLHVIGGGGYPSWALIKTSQVACRPPVNLVRAGRRASLVFRMRNTIKKPVKMILNKQQKLVRPKGSAQ